MNKTNKDAITKTIEMIPEESLTKLLTGYCLASVILLITAPVKDTMFLSATMNGYKGSQEDFMDDVCEVCAKKIKTNMDIDKIEKFMNGKEAL